MFGFRWRQDVDTGVADDRTGTTDRAWGGPPLVRGVFTLLGVLTAGFLIWLATQFDLGDTAEFWPAMGILAGAGFALGFSQLLGGWTKWGVPTLSPGVFLLGFLPALVLGGGILLATRETGQGTQDTVAGWASDIGIEGFVRDMSLFQGVIAFAIGLVFSFVFDTAGPRREHVVAHERETVVPDEDVDDYRASRDEEVVGEETRTVK
ncbi:MAG: hypothetical protein WD428_00660 [Gaiellaceae bacterium]